MNRLQEIETRLSEIKGLLTAEDCDVDALTSETDALLEERKTLLEKAETRKQTLEKLASGEIGEVKKDFRKEEKKMENTINKRSVFCKHLLGRELSTEERAELTIAPASAGAVVPEEMAMDIISKVKSYAPVLADITLLHVNGGVKFAVEGVNNEAGIHAENAVMTPASDTMVEVVLNTYEITKLIQISASVRNMAIASFESWLIDSLAEAIGMKIERLVFNGTGTSEPKGINKITWNATNSVTVAKASNTTSENIYTLFGLLKAGYARNAKAYMSRKTLFVDIMPLRDSAKHELVTRVGDAYYVLGTKVEITDAMAEHEIILGDMKKYVANLAQDVNVVSQFKIDANAHMFLGVASFDGKPALEEAFVKLVKATA